MSDEDESATDMTYEYKIHCSQSFFLHCNNSATTLALLGKIYVNDI